MTTLSEKIKPTDIIALTIIVGSFVVLIAASNNTLASSLLSMVVGFYFGKTAK